MNWKKNIGLEYDIKLVVSRQHHNKEGAVLVAGLVPSCTLLLLQMVARSETVLCRVCANKQHGHSHGIVPRQAQHVANRNYKKYTLISF